MSEDTINIEVDGQQVEARKGQMLIEVTDAMGTYVPRFCYHNKLSVAANCRMCLVEVEKAPKPLPACATPVMDGMKVFTQSAYAREAQKSVMEFLLINHPLDCPICDQGGECELQDLAMGYGNDVSRYQEKKRVVRDKDIGPLVQTEMTRCIHCTRCVRFGEEIAGLQELGATGRGENMEIGTYVEKSMTSELSGNVIDLCPVGALTSKPFRFSARTWEMKQVSGIAPHDSVGSNIHLHVRRDELKRVVPAQNELINEVWLSDRDRFSYEATYTEDRLDKPRMKVDGKWEDVEWEVALDAVANSVREVIKKSGAGKVGALVSASTSCEEIYLLQKLLRELGSNNIDHRLGQVDYTDQIEAPLFPWLGQSIEDLEQVDAALMVGSNLRKEQPMLNHRLRKAALAGAKIMQLNSVAYNFNYNLSAQLLVGPMEISGALAGILKVLLAGKEPPSELAPLLAPVSPTEDHRQIADDLASAANATVIIGSQCESHPSFSEIRALAGLVAHYSNAKLAYTGSGANSSGAWLLGGVPHRRPGGGALDTPGHGSTAMFNAGLESYLLYNVEPELDCWDGRLAYEALRDAECSVVFTTHVSPTMLEYANVLLPLACFAENEGSYINVEGTRQCFDAAVLPPGDARPGWKILRVLGNRLEVDGFDYETVADVSSEIEGFLQEVNPDNDKRWMVPSKLEANGEGWFRFSDVPMNSVDSFVRRARSLQLTTDVADGAIRINESMARDIGVSDDGSVRVNQGDISKTMPLVIDDRVAEGCVWIQAKHEEVWKLGAWFGEITLAKE